MSVRHGKVVLYLRLFKDSLAYIPRPLSGLVRMSVEEGSVPNSGSEGPSFDGGELLDLDPDEEPT